MRYHEIKLVEQKIVEYVDPETAKQDILDRVGQMDPADEENKKLLDMAYSILHKNKVGDRIKPQIEAGLKDEYNAKQIDMIVDQIISANSINLEGKKKFLNNLATDKCIDHTLFLKAAHFNLDALFYNDEVNKLMFKEFINFGAGEKRAGKGEHAFAIMSKQITQKGTGDLDVMGNPVELKVAVNKGSGRLGEGGINPEVARRTIAKVGEIADALSQYARGSFEGPNEVIKSTGKTDPTTGEQLKTQKSLNLRDFVRIINAHPEIDGPRRRAIGTLVFEQVLGREFGAMVTQVFQNPKASPEAVLDAYIEANFEHYKASEGGGAWTSLTSISLGTNSGVTAQTGKELVRLKTQGAIGPSIPAIIPTQDPEVWFQVNPTAK
jgi:hypothetical protein